MRLLIAAIVFVLIWQFVDGGLAWMLLIVTGLVVGMLSPSTYPPPKEPKTHRWTPAFGLGVGPFGIIPFITIVRRRLR